MKVIEEDLRLILQKESIFRKTSAYFSKKNLFSNSNNFGSDRMNVSTISVQFFNFER